jgi:urease accessory protein
MILISDHLAREKSEKEIVRVKVDRRTLAKRRWRGVADDGLEFGFDLPHALRNGTPFHETADKRYEIEQLPENALRIPFHEKKAAAYYGWMIGNLHFSADFHDDAVFAEDDPAIRQMLERNEISFTETKTVFEPTIISHGHHH